MKTATLSDTDDFGEVLRAMLPADESLLRYLDHMSGTPLHIDQDATESSRPQFKGAIVRYLLAFEHPQNIPPTPIYHRSVLGRTRSADIHLGHDECVSVRHCRFGITCDSASGDYVLWVEDLGSTNGTLVNGRRIEEHRPMRLKHGSRIQFGSTHCIIVQVPY